jgi:hypothetical protein
MSADGADSDRPGWADAAGRGSPFASSGTPIPVAVITRGELPAIAGAVLVTMAAEAGHDHDGADCLVCNTRGNVRVRLFELLEEARTGAIAPFSAVVVDARQARDPQGVVDALIPGKLPAFGLRDHTVARRFRLVAADSA